MAKEPQQDAATQAPAKASKRKKEFKKKREKRVVPHGVAHIQATFNNTIITICGPGWAHRVVVFRRIDRLQGIAQGNALRGAAGFGHPPPEWRATSTA